MPIQPGRNLLHYRLVDKIGEGGMGEVWKAVDTSLDRDVAIKILPQAFATDADRLARFDREAKLVASLHHPNIAVMHGLHSAEGIRFLAMELVPGEDLSARVEAGALPVEDALRIALRIATALEAAHEKGVVHRDLKPANVRISERGDVKVLDFGLAKALAGGVASGTGADGVTQTSAPTQLGTVMGTAGYMSPEQARGLEVDTRTDIWAFGCVLYETLTGKGSFGGATTSDKIASVLKEEPDLELLPASTPGRVRELIRSCLQKDADARLGDIAEAKRTIEAALSGAADPATRAERRGWSALAVPGAALVVALVIAGGAWWVSTRDGAAPVPAEDAAPDPHSVAVLPFENISADADGAAFTAGIHDDVLTQLAKIDDLKTISRTSVLEYKNSPKSISQIGRELGVAAIVEGGVQRAGDFVRINVKLLDAATEANLWAESYDRELTASNIFDIQGEIASAIAVALQATLSPQELERLEDDPTVNLEAYELYQRGLELWYRAGSIKNDLYSAEEAFLDAIDLDSQFALAHARLSEVYGDLYWVGGEPTEGRLRQCFQAANKAVELDAGLGEARLALGSCAYRSRDYERAREEYALAEKSIPGDTDLVYMQAAVTRRVGHFEEALPYFKQALELSPRDATAWMDLGLTYSYLERHDEALEAYAKALAVAPEYEEARLVRAITLCNRDATVESCRATLADLDPVALNRYLQTGFAWRLALQARAYDKAFAFLDAADEMLSYQEYDYPKDLLLGITHELTGDRDAALAAYRSAARRLEHEIAGRPDYAPHRAALGLAYAGLGRKEDAVREGRHAVDLMPVERDSLVGSWQLGDLGFIYVAVGDHEAAVDTFERYLSHPSLISARALALDPRLEPLLDNPRFRQLLAK